MNSHHLTELDRALARLLEERARIVRGARASLAAPDVEDLLRRSSGDVSAAGFRAVFDAVGGATVVARSQEARS